MRKKANLFWWSGGGVSVDTPQDIFGSNLKLWIDTSSSGKTLSGFRSTRVDSLISNDSNTRSFANSTGVSKLRYNGKCFWTPNSASLIDATKSYYNFLHNGLSGFYIAFRFQPISGSFTFPIIMNNGGTTAKTGISISYVNAANARSLSFNVTKSSAGNAVFLGTIAGFFTLGQFTTCEIVYDGATTITVYKDGVSAGTFSRLNTPVTSDATDDFNVFKDSAAATFARNCLIKDIIFANVNPTSDQRTSIRDYLTSKSEVIGATDINVYGQFGQSNTAGFPSNPPSEYRDLFSNVWLWSQTSSGASISSAQQIVQLDYGVTQNSENQTLYGPELSFAKELTDAGVGTFAIAKYAVSGSGLVNTNPTWNIAGAAAQCAQSSTDLFVNMFDCLKYEHDRNPILKGIFWGQGETDAGVGNLNYKTDLYNLIKKWVDALNTAGYTINKCRFVISLVDQPFSPPRANQTSIVTQQQAVVSDFATDNPTYADNIIGLSSFSKSAYTLIDGIHLNDDSMIQQGIDWADEVLPFINE